MTDFLQDHPDGQVLALDEMSLYFQATTTRVWSPVGQTPLVYVSPQRDHIHLYGAVNLHTGHEVALAMPVQSSLTTCHFLHHLLSCYPTQPLLLLWDRAPWHKGACLQDFFAQHPRLQTIFFPPASPHLNPQEHVWASAREAISHNHTFTEFPRLIATFLAHLADTLFLFDWLAQFAPPILFEV